MESKKDIGIVTPRGIWFDGKIYSCSLAVRHQWFKLAEYIGGWPVPLQYQECLTDQIYVLSQDSVAVKCIRIDHIPVNSSEREAYYLEFQRLVAIRKQRQLDEENIAEEQLHSDKPTNN